MVKNFKLVRLLKYTAYFLGFFFSIIILYTVYSYFNIPDIISLKTKLTFPTSVMSDRLVQLSETKKIKKLKYTYVPLSKISDNIKLAVIVSEDASFFDHDGVDWDEFEASLEKNLTKGKLSRGGSTISMQVSKNLFLSLSKNPLRKIREFFITSELEKELSKKRILEIYLNIAEWGPDGIFGIEAASRYHFNKSASELTREESARLAAILPNPIKYSPKSSAKWYTRKVRNVLYLMNYYDSRYENYLDKM